MGVQHIQMTLVDGHVGRFAYGTAGMMQPGRHIGELYEFLEVIDGCITPATRLIANERRAINRRQYKILAADHHIFGRIARDLRKFRRCC